MSNLVSFTHKGDFSNLTMFLKNAQKKSNIDAILDKYGQAGVDALMSATPVNSGLTSQSWYYTIEKKNGLVSIQFNNSNIQNGVPIAIILQYGHGTGTGGWVQGRDYINPAIQPIFDQITEEVWRDISKS